MLMHVAGAFSLPANTLYYVNVSLQNTQTTATGNYLQVMIPFNALAYTSYEASNLQNIEFSYSNNGTVADTWLEGNGLNETKATSLSSSANIIYWVKLNPSIAASSTAADVLTIDFMSTATNLFNGKTVGVAPQLYCASGCPQTSYAQYDNGANVFPAYQDFAGTLAANTLPTGWTNLSCSAPVFQVDNGLSIEPPGSCRSSYYYSAYGEAPNAIIETLASSQNFTKGLVGGLATSGIRDHITGWGFGSGLFSQNSSVISGIVNGTVSAPTSSFTVYGVYLFPNSVAAGAFYPCGNSVGCTAANVGKLVDYLHGNSSTVPNALTFGWEENVGAAPIDIYWFRSRTAPPDNVMPTATFGALTTAGLVLSVSPSPVNYGDTATFTATALSTDSLTMYVNGVEVASGTGSVKYSESDYAIGTYNITVKDTTAATSATKYLDVVAAIVVSVPQIPATAYETTVQKIDYELNVSPDATKVTLDANNAAYNAIAATPNVAAWYNYTYPVPLQQSNDTAYTFNATVDIPTIPGNFVANTLVQSELWNFIPSVSASAANIIEGSNETIYLNVSNLKSLDTATANSADVGVGNQTVSFYVASTFHYYAKLYSFINSNYALTMPTVGSPVTVSYKVPLSLAYNGVTVWRNSTGSFSTYLPSVVNCNVAGSANAISWTFWNATSPTTAWPSNVLFTGSFTVKNQLYSSNTIVGTDAGLSSTATANNYMTCLYPSWSQFRTSGSFQYSAVTAPTKANYYLQNLLTSSTVTDLKLYIYNATTPILYEVAVENVSSAQYMGALVQELLFDANTNSTLLVDEFYTQPGSGTYTYLQNQATYKWGAYNTTTGALLALTNYMVAAPCSSTACPFVIPVGNFSVNLIQSVLKNFQYSCSTSAAPSNSMTVSCSFLSLNGTQYNTSLSVENNTYNATTNLVCQKYLMTASGSSTCTAKYANVTYYTYQFKAFVRNGWYTLVQGSFGSRPTAFGADGVFLALLAILMLFFMFVTRNPTVSIVLVAAGMTAMAFVGALTLGAAGIGFMWISAGVLIFVLNRR